MNLSEDYELLESLFVQPNLSEAAGELLEVHRRGDQDVLLEMAPTTCNLLLRFASKYREWSTPPSTKSWAGSLLLANIK
jgi:hypothetical protein